MPASAAMHATERVARQCQCRMNIEETGNEERAKSCCPCNDRTRTRRAGHAALVGRAAHNLSPTSNEYTLAHSVAGALHCHGGRCRDGPTDRLLPGVRCQTRQLGAQGFWFLFFSFLLPSRRAHAACKRRRTPRVCCGDHAHVHAHDEQRPQPRSPTLPPIVRWLGEKASPVGKHLLDDQPPHRMMLL